ncbi:deoxynucleotidyltransferase terminal-interacting protein 2 [Bacillus rossius redtenbacheri]|uniref:deoxynucleotidyltransferase terminal-interacting protein 2 n=1 Tax=Bacillus rossius redtenbacheri TaxID=93214 RepID=UPI002FDED4A7
MDSLFVIDTGGSKKKKKKEVEANSAEIRYRKDISKINLTEGIYFGNNSEKSEKQSWESLGTLDMSIDRSIFRKNNPFHLDKNSNSVDEIMKKSVITPGLEKCEAVPMAETSKRKLSKLRKLERERTKGSKWFNMPAPEMTEELKHDLQVLQMRSVLDPKHFYKKNDLKVLPKYFQVGKVIEAPADFYHSRVPKKMRKKTIVEELLADAEFQKYNKKRYKEIIEQRRKTHFKAHKQAKKLKRKKKRH